MTWKRRPGGTTRPNTSQADRDLIEHRLPDVDEHVDDPKLLHHDEPMPT